MSAANRRDRMPFGSTDKKLEAMSNYRTRLVRVRNSSPREFAQRLATLAYNRSGAAALSFHLRRDDIISGDRLVLPAPDHRPPRDRPLTIGWIMTPPSAGSGGHTTMLRMVEALESAGHRCTLFLYDARGVDLTGRTAIIRQHWPQIRADINDVDDGIDGVDACIATSWETAHVLASRGVHPMRRLYFIQDFEPYFYARGSEYEFATMTYRFPFRKIALGAMVGDTLRTEVGVSSDLVPFGCDTQTYRLQLPQRPRSGVVLYCKPNVPRRGFLLATTALEIFHRRHPDQPIKLYGTTDLDPGFPAQRLGRLSPAELNDLYNTSIAGIAMSFTNISLVAEEMLASGAIPVVNDSPLSRADLENAWARWAPATPEGLAGELSEAVQNPDIPGTAAAAAASVTARSWETTQRTVREIIEEEVWGPRHAGRSTTRCMPGQSQ